ncbi:MAG: anthrax toxin-like adenylyl cyclase domain-containing protein [Enterovibrio sp.]
MAFLRGVGNTGVVRTLIKRELIKNTQPGFQFKFTGVRNTNLQPATIVYTAAGRNSMPSLFSASQRTHFVADQLKFASSSTKTAKPQSLILQKYQDAIANKNTQQSKEAEKSVETPKSFSTKKLAERFENRAKLNFAAKVKKVDVLPTVIEAANENVEAQYAANADAQENTMARRLSGASLKTIAAEKAQLEKIGKPFVHESLLYSKALQQTANKYHVVIGLRTPNKFGEVHLREGFPTKNFHVKAKSSQTGPTAGFITQKAVFSKVGPEHEAEHQKEIDKALQKGAKLIDLRLSAQQLKNVLEHGLMKEISEGRYSAIYHGQEFNFSIKPPDNLVVDTADGQAVKVLTNPPEVDESGKPVEGEFAGNNLKPITSDYDLFALIPRKNQSINERNVPVRARLLVQPKTVVDGKAVPFDITKKPESAFAQALLKFTTPDLSKLDPNKGNFHNFGSAIIHDINANAKEEGYRGGKLVWHGDEIGNPFSHGFDENDSPIFFIPNQEPIQITSEAELHQFYDKLQELGYEPERSPRFNI